MAYQMPRPEIGDLVWYYPDGDLGQKPRPAFITHVGEMTVSCSVIEKDAYSLAPFDGVRHKDDPVLKSTDARQMGVWSYRPQPQATKPLSQEGK